LRARTRLKRRPDESEQAQCADRRSRRDRADDHGARAEGTGAAERALIRAEGESSQVKRAVGARFKEWASFALYVAAVPAAFVSPIILIAIYVGLSIVWLVPDRRFERRLRG
jgi:cobalamin synthase